MELESILLPGVEAKRPIVIAGPCSAETEEQVMDTAKQLAAKGQKIYRAGIWKPRTKPGGFEGIGVEGLAWLKEVKKETGMYVSTEVATAKHARGQAVLIGRRLKVVTHQRKRDQLSQLCQTHQTNRKVRAGHMQPERTVQRSGFHRIQMENLCFA
mgnify:CR=1 FL=1